MSSTEQVAVKPIAEITMNNQAWQARKTAAIARGEGNIAPVYVSHASNAEVWDVEGKRYIDFGTGIAVCNTGHSHPKVVAAVKQQIERFSHTCIMVTPYDGAVLLAEALNELVPGDSDKKTMFVTTGAEAVENAIKIARSHTGRRAVISFNGGYHGRTNLTLGLTGKNAPYKTRFGPFPADIYRAPFPVEFHGVTVADSLKALDMVLKCDVAAEDVAAIIIEPVQGEGGFYPAPKPFLEALRKICDQYGIVLIADEIQSGFARTGKFFAMEYSGVEADLTTVAKGMAGGYPLAAVVGKADIMNAPDPGGLGGTYAGSPVGCAAALAVIDIIQEEGLLDAAINIGRIFKDRLTELKKQFPDTIGHVRADRGAMAAVEIIRNGDPEQPSPQLVSRVVELAYQRGLILLSCGIRGNVFRFLPALTMSESLLREGLDIFAGCLKTALSESSGE